MDDFDTNVRATYRFEIEDDFDTNVGAGGPPGPVAQSFVSNKLETRLLPRPRPWVSRDNRTPPPFHQIPHFI